MREIRKIIRKIMKFYKQYGAIQLVKKVILKINLYCRIFIHINVYAENIAHVQSVLNSGKSIVLSDIFIYDMPMLQRPQHIARELGALGWNYIFTEPSYNDIYYKEVQKNVLTISSSIGKKKNFFKQSLILNCNSVLHLYATDQKDRADIIQHARAIGACILYEYADEIHPDLSGQQTPEHVITRHNDMLTDCDIKIVATADKLYEECLIARNSTKNIALVPNGTEYEHFARATRKHIPEKIERIVNDGKPIVGYWGALASWFDYDLLGESAKRRPEYNFILIGIDYDGSMSKHAMNRMGNVHYLGIVDYKELPAFGAFFDTAVIPFVINEITLSTSPIKLFEYMSLGLETVTTEMPECKKYPYVYTVNSVDDFISSIDKNISRSGDVQLKSEIKAFVKDAHSWSSRAKLINELLESNAHRVLKKLQ